MADRTKDEQRQYDHLAAGEQLDEGWCFNPDGGAKAVYRCTAEDKKVAVGDVSRSLRGDMVTDLASGETTRQNPSVTLAGDLANGGAAAGAPGGGGGGGGGRTVTTEGAHP